MRAARTRIGLRAASRIRQAALADGETALQRLRAAPTGVLAA
jgi:hypothetical protein